MSAILSEADIARPERHLRFGPQPNSCTAANSLLFDHVVDTGEQCWGYIEPKRLRSFEVDYQFELCRLFDGKVCGAFPCENATDIVACATEQGWVIRSIRHQPAD